MNRFLLCCVLLSSVSVRFWVLCVCCVCACIDKHYQAMISHYFCIKNTIEKRIICWWCFVLLLVDCCQCWSKNAGFVHFPATLTEKTCHKMYNVKINLHCQWNQPTHLVLCSFTGNLVSVDADVEFHLFRLSFVVSLLFFADFHITELCAHSHTHTRAHVELKQNGY